MSVAAAASPVLGRTSSTRNPPSAYGTTQAIPQRARSNNQRPPSSSQHRSNSRTGSHIDASQNTPLANVQRQDHEQTNLARSGSSRRQSRDVSRSAYEEDAARQRASSRGSRRDSQEFSVAPRAPANGVNTQQANIGPQQAPLAHHPSYNAQGKRRTSITTQTGTWSLGKTIGQGSMGKVKVATNAQTGETVAIKIIPRQSADEHGNIKDDRSDRSKEIRTAREAAMATLLDHPYICGMRDVQRTNYHWYMLFEYVDGGQMLDYIIAHGRLKEKQARKFGRQIASALDYCHRNNIVHRDLKIENILISKSGDIKIIDFGLSNLYSPRSLLKTFCGSLYFAAPELLNARQYTGPEVDVWSFGIVLYVLVCGKVPFDDQSMPQLHAKIKRGVVEYPQWLSTECRNIISRMLVVEVKERATLQEIMNHPWMTKGFPGPPENYVPHRDPVQLPLDPQVINKMQGFDFGPASYIQDQMTRIIESEDYQSSVRGLMRDVSMNGPLTPGMREKRGVFDFYKRRNSISREGLAVPSSEALRSYDAVNAYSPLLSVYQLAREKMNRERHESNPGALSLGTPANAPPLRAPGLPEPPQAHTNEFTPELAGEKITGGRSRPRARTNGEDDMQGSIPITNQKKEELQRAPVSPNVPPLVQEPRKEGTAMGLLRRFSTRRQKDRPTESMPPPSFNIQAPPDSATPKKSFSVRRSRKRASSPPTMHPGGSQDAGLLNPSTSKRSGLLNRSTSVNSADFRSRRLSGRNAGNEAISPRLTPQYSEAPGASDSDHSAQRSSRQPEMSEVLSQPLPSTSTMSRAPHSTRTKSMGHARAESMQTGRTSRREDRVRGHRHENVPEETDAEVEQASQPRAQTTTQSNAEISRPAGLKGLFSSSTTSNKPPQFIRHDLIRVLQQLGVEYTEVRGGFICRHAPSINLDDIRNEPLGERSSGKLQGNSRRISFGGFRRDRDDIGEEKLSRSKSKRRQPDASFITNSDGSDEYLHPSMRSPRAGDAAATSTRVQDDAGDRLVLKFEVAIVKIPLFNLHGIQFKKVQGGMNQYRSMTATILNSLRL